MKDVDFSICQFIRDELCFLNYYDFCKNAKILKAYYDALDKNGKIFYKWYVYANVHMDEKYKNLVWDYLNDAEEVTYTVLIEGLNKYKAR